ncbi:DUF5074 domain-containing protein [uncultured Weeksella sp.]|uniref:T9SS type A sorting domain-containing protein n=1 Tax=uncultured Weeksella sp. TaxID=1161389 RepID=UPI00259AFFED|nr:DUF5074 domain-containing protein [uncultured Weeksella sp.]
MRKLYLLVVLFLTISVGLQAQVKVQGILRNDLKKPEVLQKAGDPSFTFDDIQYWIGEGSKKAAMVVQWNDNKNPEAMVWGYRFDGEKFGIDMILEIAKVDPRFYVLAYEGTQYGTAIGGFGYDWDNAGTRALVKNNNTTYPYYPIDGKVLTNDYDFDDWTAFDPNDRWYSGWFSKGFWSYWVKDSADEDFAFSGLGASSRKLEDGSWDGWSFSVEFQSFPMADKFTAAEPNAEEPIDFTKGYFIVNEEWFGHTNGSVNFIDENDQVHYRVYSDRNNNEAFGATTQFGTIYGDKFYFVSKQAADAGDTNYTPGGRLVVADAKTMEKIASFDDIGGGDGRSFLGVNPKTAYIASSNGVFLFDIENMKVGEIIEGTGGGSTYSGQVGNLIRTKKYVFAVKQNTGILVIDPITHTLVQTIEGNFHSVVQAQDGKVWGALDNSLVAIDQFSLETSTIDLPENISIPNSWGAWNAGSFTASAKENNLYFFPGKGWSVSPNLVKFDASTHTFDPDFIIIPGQDETYKQIPYGAGVRVHPKTDEIIITTTESGYGAHYQKNWVHRYSSNGELVKTIQMNDYYWFPAVTVFPDTEAPKVEGLENNYTVEDNLIINLNELVSDEDNLDAAIVINMDILQDDDLATIELSDEGILSVSLNADKEKSNTQKTPIEATGEIKIRLDFESNGLVTEHFIDFTINKLGLNSVEKSQFILYPNPTSEAIFIDAKEVAELKIYSILGQEVMAQKLQPGKNTVRMNTLPKGTYIFHFGNETKKVIKK